MFTQKYPHSFLYSWLIKHTLVISCPFKNSNCRLTGLRKEELIFPTFFFPRRILLFSHVEIISGIARWISLWSTSLVIFARPNSPDTLLHFKRNVRLFTLFRREILPRSLTLIFAELKRGNGTNSCWETRIEHWHLWICKTACNHHRWKSAGKRLLFGNEARFAALQRDHPLSSAILVS